MAEEKKQSSRQLSNILRKLDKKVRDKSLQGKLSPEVKDQLSNQRERIVKAIQDRADEELKDKTIIKEVTERIDTNKLQKRIEGVTEKLDQVSPIKKFKKPAEKITDKTGLISGKAFKDKITKLRALNKMARKGLKSVPVLGTILGIGSSLKSGDVLAATPLGDVESVGVDKAIEDPRSPEFKKRREALNKMRAEKIKEKLNK